MGHVHPPRALLYRLPNVSTHWGAIRARLGPERWLEAAAHVVHRACSAERAELVAAPRRVRVCVCMCVNLVPLCVVVLAAPGACMSLRVRYDIRVDLIPCTCVVFIGGVRSYILCGAPRVNNRLSRVARIGRARGGPFTSISEFLNRTRTARQPRTPTRRPPGGARARAPGRAVARSHTHTPRHRAHKSAAKETLTFLYDSHRPLRRAPGARARIFDLGGNTP